MFAEWNKTINPSVNIIPPPTPKICIIIYAHPAKKQWIAYNAGATNKNVNSSGSVIPVNIEVNAAESNKPPTIFFFSGFAQRYIANAAPGHPKIINGNLPDINLVAETLKCVMLDEPNSAKKIFCAP